MTTIQLAASALAVSLSYYLGANLGLILRFPPATPSVMWPPNAILTATLLLTPPSSQLERSPPRGESAVCRDRDATQPSPAAR